MLALMTLHAAWCPRRSWASAASSWPSTRTCRSRPCSWSRVPLLAVIVALIISRMRPAVPARCRCASTAINQVLREQITGIRVVRAFVREPSGAGALRATANDDLFDVGLGVGRLMALMFPSVILVINSSSVAVAVVRRPPDQRRLDAGRGPDRLSQLPRPDPDGGDDGHLHVRDGAAGRGLRRADRGGPRHRVDACAARRADPVGTNAHGTLEFARRRVPLPGRRSSRCCTTSPSRRAPARPRR